MKQPDSNPQLGSSELWLAVLLLAILIIALIQIFVPKGLGW